MRGRPLTRYKSHNKDRVRIQMANMNSGKEWSVTELFDLRNHLAQGVRVEETARFLCRDVEEVRAKATELGWLPKLHR
jgi:hypothetical protein